MDAYFLPPDVEYSINSGMATTKSMLVIPMKDHKEQLIGVLQLRSIASGVRRRPRQPQGGGAAGRPEATVELVTALAGQAAVAIENSR